jgi:hypothetical protein
MNFLRLYSFIFLMTSLPIHSQNKTDEKQQFYLLYESFVQTNDLKNAYTVIQKAREKWPDDIEWEKKEAQVLLWTGDQKRAADLYLDIYRKDKTFDITKLIDNICVYNLDFCKEYYRDILNKKFNEKNFIKLLKLYEDDGDINNVNNLIRSINLKNLPENVINDIYSFYINSDNFDMAIELIGDDNCNSVKVKSKLLFLKKDFKAFSDILKKNYDRCKDDKEYLYFLADSLYITRDFEPMINILNYIYSSGAYREQDLSRLFDYYATTNTEKAADISISGYKMTKKDYFLYMYLSLNIDNHKKLETIKMLAKENNDKILKYPLIMMLRLQENDNFSDDDIKEVENTILNIGDKTVLEDLLWSVLSTNSREIKNYITSMISCETENNPDVLIPLSYIKLDLGYRQEAANCFRKGIKHTSLSAGVLNSYSEFLSQSGDKVSSDFYRRLSYDIFSKKDELTDDELYEFMSLKIIYENNDGIMKKIMETKLPPDKKHSLIASYILQNDMYEKLSSYDKKYLPSWVMFYIAYNTNDFDKIKNFENEPSFYKELAEAYDRKNLREKALNYSYDAISKTPYDYSITKQFINLTDKYYPYNTLSFLYSDRDFIKTDEYSLSYNIYIQNNIYINYMFLYDIYTSNDKNQFLYKSLYDNYNKITFSTYDTAFYIGLRNSIENFFTFGFDKKISSKYININSGFNIKDKSEENTYMETAGFKNTLYINIAFNYSTREKISLDLRYQEYFDQNNSYIGRGFVPEIRNDFKLSSKLNLSTYYSNGGFVQFDENITGTTLSNVSPYNNIKLLPDNYNEFGITFYISDIVNTDYRKKFIFPLNINIAYNSSTDLAYYVELFIKSPSIKKSYFLTKLSYYNNYNNNSDNLFSIFQSIKFK